MSPCIICEGEYKPSPLPGLVRCGRCGFVSANMVISAEELLRLYGRHYFEGEEYRDYRAERPILEKHFRRRLKRLLQFVPNANNRNLIEIGCAYGFFLGVARHDFATVQGFDISAEAVNYARQQMGLSATTIDFLDYAPRDPVDVVCMWDTIEHLQHPHAYVEKLAQIMPRGGVVAVTTGDIESLVARLRGSRWRQIHPPTHLHYFSRRTLEELLKRNGFRIRYSGFDGQFRSLDTIVYVILTIRQKKPGLYNALKRAGLLRFSLYLNLYDIMYLIAEKI